MAFGLGCIRLWLTKRVCRSYPDSQNPDGARKEMIVKLCTSRLFGMKYQESD